MVLRQRGKKIDLLNLKRRLLAREVSEMGSDDRSEIERVRIATCVLLLEVAKSDDEFCSLEKQAIETILKKDFEIPKEAIRELMDIAHRSREDSVDLWEFTNLINENYSREEKMKIMESVWKVIYADDKLDMYEDHLVHKLANLLRLDHSELIQTKLEVLEGDSD